MAIEKKLSVGTSLLLKNLTAEIAETLNGEKPSGDLEVTFNRPGLTVMLDGYTTKISTGETLSVGVDDIEKVGNFRRDFQQATRLYAGDAGLTHLEENSDADSFRLTATLADLGTSVQAAFFRPGKEEQGNTNFVSITDAWDGSAEDKAVEEHLKGLSKKLGSGKK